MKFQFRFEILLRLRTDQRDQAGAAVGQADQAIAKIETQIREVDQCRRELQGSIAEMSGSRQPMIDHLLNSGRYDLQLQAEKRALNEALEKLEQERERRMLRLTQAEQEVKRLERLRDKDGRSHRERELKNEQAEIDEAASRNRHRRQPFAFDLHEQEPWS